MIVSAKLILSILIPDISSLRRSWQNTIASQGRRGWRLPISLRQDLQQETCRSTGKMAAIGLLRRKMKRFNFTVHSLVKPRMPASVTGPWKSTLFLRRIHCRGMLLYGVGARPPPYGVRRGKGRSNLRDAGWPGFSPSPSCKHCGLTQSIVPAGTPLREGRCLSCPKTVKCFSFCAAGCEQFLCPAERRFSVMA
jgi:hypothetical protein